MSAFTSALEGPKSADVCGYSNAAPVLTNPGNRSSTVGLTTTLQLQGSDPDGQAITYSSSGLPPGLSLSASTGFISGTGTTAGSYPVTVRASDGVLTTSQAFTWTMAPRTTSDATAPTITITAPTTSGTFAIASSTITISGTAADNIGVTQITWVNDRGGNGVASGTTSWSTPAIDLQAGTNVITVNARDAAGNQAIDTVTVTVATAPAVTLTAQPIDLTSNDRVRLTWTPAPWSQVSIYRNGALIAETSDNESFVDWIRSASGSFTYRVCAPNQTVCSNAVTVTF